MKSAFLDNRGLILVSGDDARSFLQGIITNDIMQLHGDKTPHRAMYSAFLTPQGKYLADFFMYAHEDGILLDVDMAILENLLKRMTMFKLRSKVTLDNVSDRYTIHAVWNTHLHPDIPNVQIFADPRAAVMGYRILGSHDTKMTGDQGGEQGDYRLFQMENGLADVHDFERERTSMLEANMDYLNALSWTKGCYMGQELTARTHYRGLIKKRFLPIVLPQDMTIAADTAIKRDGKTIGFIRGNYKNHAIGLVQLDVLDAGHDCDIDGVSATIQIPEWFAAHHSAHHAE